MSSREVTVMIDWTMFSPTFLTAVAEWAGAVVTVLAVGPRRSTTKAQRKENPVTLVTPAVRRLAAKYLMTSSKGSF
jgi:hypothetical protein